MKRSLLPVLCALCFAQRGPNSAVQPTSRSDRYIADTNTNNHKSYTHFASKLHADLMENYNKAVPPRSNRTNSYSQAGTDVELQIRFFKILSVTPSSGTLELKVWYRMMWQDERLAWDPADYNGITEVGFHAYSHHDMESSEIWLPDVQPYNAVSGLMHTLDAASAKVTPSGTVYWSRPGKLEVLCRFSGLASFPHDVLSCPIEIGGWALSGTHQGLISHREGCATWEKTEEVSRESYQEYVISRVECSLTFYKYTWITATEEIFPIINYRVFLTRVSGRYWTSFVLFPSILFVVLSFAVLFMSFEAGERLGYGVTLLLTTEVSKATISTLLPICGEELWVEYFIQVNTVFTALPLLESTIVLGIAYNSEQYLISPFYTECLYGLAGFFTRAGRRVWQCARGLPARVADSASERQRPSISTGREEGDGISAAAAVLRSRLPKFTHTGTSANFYAHLTQLTGQRWPSAGGAEGGGGGVIASVVDTVCGDNDGHDDDTPVGWEAHTMVKALPKQGTADMVTELVHSPRPTIDESPDAQLPQAQVLTLTQTLIQTRISSCTASAAPDDLT